MSHKETAMLVAKVCQQHLCDLFSFRNLTVDHKCVMLSENEVISHYIRCYGSHSIHLAWIIKILS